MDNDIRWTLKFKKNQYETKWARTIPWALYNMVYCPFYILVIVLIWILLSRSEMYRPVNDWLVQTSLCVEVILTLTFGSLTFLTEFIGPGMLAYIYFTLSILVASVILWAVACEGETVSGAIIILLSGQVIVPWLAFTLLHQSLVSHIWPLLILTLVSINGTFTLAATSEQISQLEAACLGLIYSTVGIAAYIFRYFKELSERMAFLDFIHTERRLTVLHQAVIRLSPVRGDTNVHGESVLEEMLSLLKQTENLLSTASSKTQSPETLKAIDIIKEVLKTMSVGGDLFQVRFANLGEEGESIIDQYVRGNNSKVKKTAGGFQLSKENDDNDSSALHEYSSGGHNNGGSVAQVNGHSISLTYQQKVSPMPPNASQPTMDTKQARQAAMNTRRLRNTNVPFDCYINPNPSATPDSGSQMYTSNLITVKSIAGKVGRDWSFDAFRFLGSHPDVLIQFGAILLLPYCGFLSVTPEGVLGFLGALQECYWDNAYHNKLHAAVVAHASGCFANMLKMTSGSAWTELMEVVSVTASLGHDVGHPSRTNQFFINTYDPLAVIYNDVSVLENYHAFVTFQILDKEARRRIIEIILATDMKEHFEAISKFRIRRCAADFNYRDEPEDMWHCLRIIVKAADLSHGCVEWNQHFLWSCLIQEEFYQQGEEEKSLGQPISPLCDRNSHSSFAKSQKGFLEFVVAPLFTELREIDPASEMVTCLENLWNNKEHWTQLENTGEYVEFPEYVKRYQEKRRAELRVGGGLKAMWLFVNRLANEHQLATETESDRDPNDENYPPQREHFNPSPSQGSGSDLATHPRTPRADYEAKNHRPHTVSPVPAYSKRAMSNDPSLSLSHSSYDKSVEHKQRTNRAVRWA